MSLSDTWLKANNGKKTEKRIEKSDRDGLSVRVTPKGKITFQVRYRHNGKAARVDLGSYPLMSLKMAREECLRIRGMLEKGYDPRVVKRLERNEITSEISVESAFRQWFESYCIPNKKKSHEIIRSFEIYVFPEIGDLPIKKIDVNKWLSILEVVASEKYGIAFRLLGNAKQALKWCARRELINKNPLSDISAKADLNITNNVRDRYLSDDEIKMIWTSLERSRISTGNKIFIKLCLFYGCRVGELKTARKNDFDFNRMVWTIPAESHKTGYKTKKPIIRPIILEVAPLIKEASEISKSDNLLFSNKFGKMLPPSSHALTPGLINSWVSAIWEYEMPHWSMHALRRTVRTNMSNITDPHIAEIILGHKLPGVWQAYDKYDYLKEQAIAYKKWWERLMDIVSE